MKDKPGCAGEGVEAGRQKKAWVDGVVCSSLGFLEGFPGRREETGENRMSMAKALVDGAWYLPERKAGVGRGQGPGENFGPWELFEIYHVFILGKRGTSQGFIQRKDKI